jgi:peptide/nickel transport system ATP-binding protein
MSGADPILTVKGLGVDFWVDGRWYPAARDMNYEVRPGEVLAIVGESGSGKSSSSMALIGLTPPNGRVVGSAVLNGTELVGLTGARLRRARGRDVAVIFQEPMTALNPVYTVGFQIVETVRTHTALSPSEAKARAIELLTMVEMPEPAATFSKYPHQLSGGQRQRAMIAQAISCDPALLIADEPTTALDVTIQAEILDLMRALKDRLDSGIILITHDMGVVADMADRMLVMKDGVVVESGTAHQIFTAPQHPYTRQLLDAVPRLRISTGEVDTAAPPAPAADAVVTLDEVSIEYPRRGRVPAFKAVDRVSFSIGPREVVGLVGESGSGKTTIGRAIVGLLKPSEGRLTVVGRDLTRPSRAQLRATRRDIGIVFQDPGSSLNPRFPIGQSIGEPLLLAGGDRAANHRRVEELLDAVQLPRSFRNRYPHELSGGQRQRVGVARALALSPKLLVADEPTSALDVSVQARLLELLRGLQLELGFACLFISHDLAVVDLLSDRIAVMHRGRLAEYGGRDQVLRNPQDAYTQRLISAIPLPDPALQAERRAARASA